MPNWNFVKRQLKFDKPRPVSIHKNTQSENENTSVLRIFLFIIIFNGQKHHHNIKQWSGLGLLTLTTFSMT